MWDGRFLIRSCFRGVRGLDEGSVSEGSVSGGSIRFRIEVYIIVSEFLGLLEDRCVAGMVRGEAVKMGGFYA
jgi:hypothetical protein